jgi:hypothetical protein
LRYFCTTQQQQDFFLFRLRQIFLPRVATRGRALASEYGSAASGTVEKFAEGGII